MTGSAAGERKEYYSRQELANLLQSYCERENLLSATSKKLYIVDAHLSQLDAVASRQATTKTKKEVSRDVLLKSLLRHRHCTQHHAINGGKVKKGGVPSLTIVMESRQGRKSVTRITHLERFFTDAQHVDTIVDELKRKCAVSVSVGEVKGTKPGSSVELTVQGKKSGEAQEVLQKWGIKPSMIKVEDKTK